MGCVIYDTAGSHTWPWPDGVDRAVVITRGASGGGSSGTLLRGGAAGGAGAFAERLCLKTDPDAAIIVGAGGLGGAGGNNVDGDDGEDSSFLQASTIVQNCYAAGGKGAVGPAGGDGGLAADSYGTIKFGGGTGGSSGFGDGGGGGGAAGCATSDGEDGEDDPGTDQGGEGGAACPNTGNDSTGGGRGGNEFANGSDGGDGGGGGAGIRPGIGVFTDGGKGSGGYVEICWEDPEPTGYCVDDSCKKWWGFGQGCGYYRYGKRCFYYGYRYPYFPYQYFFPGLPIGCCSGTIYGNPLTLTITNLGDPACTLPSSQTAQLIAAADGGYYAWIPEFGGYLVWNPAECGQLFCTWANWDFGGALSPGTCSPLYLVAHAFVNPGGICVACSPAVFGTVTHRFEITL